MVRQWFFKPTFEHISMTKCMSEAISNSSANAEPPLVIVKRSNESLLVCTSKGKKIKKTFLNFLHVLQLACKNPWIYQT